MPPWSAPAAKLPIPLPADRAPNMTQPLLLLLLLLAGCLPKFAAAPADEEPRLNCDYPNLPGREFLFRATDQALENIDYHPWKKSPAGSDKQKPYRPVAGEKAKLNPRPLAGHGGGTWFQATTERCQAIFAQREKSEKIAPQDPWLELPDAYFLDTYREAESKIGQVIFAKPATRGLERFDTPDPKVSYAKANLEPLTIVALDPREYSHTHGSNRPFYLVLRRSGGEEVLLPYDRQYFHESDPLDPAWSPEVVAKIKAQELFPGMRASQVILAWGKPKKIKPLATAAADEEQWFYDSGLLLSFRNGILTQFPPQGKP